MLIALPWKTGAKASEVEEMVASVTRLRVTRWRDVPRLLVTALRLRARFPLDDGGLAVGLAAQPFRRTFWTLTLWHDEDALLAYVRNRDHAEAMRSFRTALAEATSERWATRARPSWSEARQHVGRQ